MQTHYSSINFSVTDLSTWLIALIQQDNRLMSQTKLIKMTWVFKAALPALRLFHRPWPFFIYVLFLLEKSIYLYGIKLQELCGEFIRVVRSYVRVEEVNFTIGNMPAATEPKLTMINIK